MPPLVSQRGGRGLREDDSLTDADGSAVQVIRPFDPPDPVADVTAIGRSAIDQSVSYG
jgi:hypothetical protein